MENGARLLEHWAKVLKDSGKVGVKGHPRYGKFDDDSYGKADEADHHELTQTARELRRLAKLER